MQSNDALRFSLTASLPMSDTPNWSAILSEHLPVSVSDANEALSRAPAVQKWMRTTAAEIATEQPPGGMPASQGYSTAKKSLHQHFPGLQTAIQEHTCGHGDLDIEWRPFSPHLSQVQVQFNRDMDVHAFIRLDTVTREALGDVLDTQKKHLPKSEPFPRRPHVRTVLIAHGNDAVGVHLYRHHPNDGVHLHTFTLLPPDAKPTTDLQREALLTQLLNRWA